MVRRGREHIAFRSEEFWGPEAKRGQKWRAWEDLDDKGWIVLDPGPEGRGLGLPLGLKVFGPWAHHIIPKRWVCVIDVKKKKKEGRGQGRRDGGRGLGRGVLPLDPRPTLGGVGG